MIGMKSTKVNPWIYDINTCRLIVDDETINYWIHRTEKSIDHWLLTNFNYNITNLNLKTNDLETAKQRAILIIKNKHYSINNAIDTISQFTNKYRKNNVKLSNKTTLNILKFANQIKHF